MEMATWIIRLSDGSNYVYVGTEIAAAAFACQMAWSGITYEVSQVKSGPLKI